MHPIVGSDRTILIVGDPAALFKIANKRARLIWGSSRPSGMSAGSITPDAFAASVTPGPKWSKADVAGKMTD